MPMPSSRRNAWQMMLGSAGQGNGGEESMLWSATWGMIQEWSWYGKRLWVPKLLYIFSMFSMRSSHASDGLPLQISHSLLNGPQDDVLEPKHIRILMYICMMIMMYVYQNYSELDLCYSRSPRLLLFSLLISQWFHAVGVLSKDGCRVGLVNGANRRMVGNHWYLWRNTLGGIS